MGEVPELYLQHSGFKLFYALKTFQIKRWDYYRNEALRDISRTGGVVKDSWNAVKEKEMKYFVSKEMIVDMKNNENMKKSVAV